MSLHEFNDFLCVLCEFCGKKKHSYRTVGRMSPRPYKEIIMSADTAVKYVTEITEEEEKRVAEWINTEEYKEKNFERQALVINPAHACQPSQGQNW